jgi:hypothetical protein
MSKSTLSQRSLYLVSRLYELAAEFNDIELQEILHEKSFRSKMPAVKQAIQALRDMHDIAYASQIGAQPVEATTTILDFSDELHSQLQSKQASSLEALFEDRTVFPSVNDIAAAMQIERKPKESRDRYLARCTKFVQAMTSHDRALFFEKLTKRLDKQPENFISKWSKLIKEL